MNWERQWSKKARQAVFRIGWFGLIAASISFVLIHEWNSLRQNILSFIESKTDAAINQPILSWTNFNLRCNRHPSAFSLVHQTFIHSFFIFKSFSVPAIMHRDASYSSFTVLVRYWWVAFTSIHIIANWVGRWCLYRL